MNDQIKITILGCGSSTGVPRVGNEWGSCNPKTPENRRTRCSLLIEKCNGDKKTTIVIDTGPDFRNQMNQANIKKIDAVFYTHEHADHTHGIDDLRMYALRDKSRINVYASTNTSQDLHNKFGYCFNTNMSSSYPPILNMNIINHAENYEINGEGGIIKITPFNQAHGNITSFGYKINNIAYSSDISDVPEESIQFIENSDKWIVDALRWIEHPTHFHVDKALSLIKYFNIRKAILTNMHIDLDYYKLCEYLPSNVIPAYDGMKV